MYDREVFTEYSRRATEKNHSLSRVQHIKTLGSKIHHFENTSILNFTTGDLINELTTVKDTFKAKNMVEIPVKPSSKQLFMALEGLLQSELKNPQLVNVITEALIKSFGISCDTVKVYFGNYEIPMKRLFGADNYMVNECETSEIYSHLVFTFIKDKKVVNGVIYPALDAERYGNLNALNKF